MSYVLCSHTWDLFILSYRSFGCQHVCFIFATQLSQITFLLAPFDTVVSHLVTLLSLSFWIIVSWIWYIPHILFLINKLFIVTPPNAVGYANGIAQSMASLARCIGPVVGGYVSWNGIFQFCFTEVNCTCQMWAISIRDNPSGYYLGFVVCAGVCSLSFLQSFLIR